jgi:hypothetical protein
MKSHIQVFLSLASKPYILTFNNILTEIIADAEFLTKLMDNTTYNFFH